MQQSVHILIRLVGCDWRGIFCISAYTNTPQVNSFYKRDGVNGLVLDCKIYMDKRMFGEGVFAKGQMPSATSSVSQYGLLNLLKSAFYLAVDFGAGI